MNDKNVYIKENLATPVAFGCDVAVAGGGVAGIAAALSAARAGAKVALIERGFTLGGLATAGLVTIYLPLCDGKGRQVSFSLAEELFTAVGFRVLRRAARVRQLAYGRYDASKRIRSALRGEF